MLFVILNPTAQREFTYLPHEHTG